MGEVNCNFIRDFLHNEGIPVDAEDSGGDFARMIHFVTGDFTVYRRKVGHNRSERIAMRDRACWQQALKKKETEGGTASD